MVIDEVICVHGHRRSDLRVWSWRTDTGLTWNERDASNASRSFIPVENARTGLLGDVPMRMYLVYARYLLTQFTRLVGKDSRTRCVLRAYVMISLAL